VIGRSALLLLCCAACNAGCNGQLRFSDPDAATSAPGCFRDLECRLPSLHCDVVSKRCVACRMDADCAQPGAPRCDLALHRCVECGANSDCASQEICEPTTRRCVVQCAEGPAEHICPDSAPTCNELGNFCMQCRGDADCQLTTDDGQYCDNANGRCAHCVDDRHCSAPQPRCDRTRGRCGECVTVDDCPPHRVCDLNTLRCM
jgi:hypothetical protein